MADKQPLTYRITARDRYSRNGAVEITFAFANSGTTTAWVLRWNTPFEPLSADIFRVACEGRPELLRYVGRMVKRGDPDSRDYVSIGAGEEQSVVVDLALSYDFRAAASGRCDVDFTGEMLDVQYAETLSRRGRDRFAGALVHGTGARFSVVD